ncbi:hypothetical protein DFA_04607 [Cavenderia fasciculata]|uniref:Zeta toxin domain-containing protein n=1 Tax=Cavenderia fasciculata TaxID=261658 RepID=F4PQ16_CACFS|nr:uncharacterized protein DFA_04607 [Cavenderia fasciculata]EGG22479.1 hypothetical protein DFA_04607 [Cavenderia fasciculata]|eukprot:XP_004360330.1 hypothetical protein DFA_04607 [Cavenderia fasciculata]
MEQVISQTSKLNLLNNGNVNVNGNGNINGNMNVAPLPPLPSLLGETAPSSSALNTTSNNVNSNSNPLSASSMIQHADCIRDGTLAYIYIVEDALTNNKEFCAKPLVPLPSVAYAQHSPNGKLGHPFIHHSSTNPLQDLSNTKEIFDYINFFDVNQALYFHQNDNIKRYSRYHLNLTLKFMGCKSLHARQITSSIFDQLENCRVEVEQQQQNQQNQQGHPLPPAPPQHNFNSNNYNNFSNADNLPVYCVSLLRSTFYYIVGHILSTYQYSKPQYISDFPVACDVQEKKHSFTILLGGTSGCGKSTLTALLASRIGFAAVISTDNIRQILRKFISRTESPILWASTYHAGEIISNSSLSHKEKILQGYEAQNDMIFNKLDSLIDQYEKRNESLIVEGVHLDTRIIIRLCEKHPSCIPFLMYISNEAKHKERFAIRSKYMTLDPHQNKYTKYFKNIRIINNYLCQGADSISIPQIDNTSIDRSLATIHGTIFACLKRKAMCGEPYFNPDTKKLTMLHQEYEQIQHQFWSSKGMLRLIRKKRYSGVQVANAETGEAAFNSDDEDQDDDHDGPEKRVSFASKVKTHSRDKNMSNTSTYNNSDSESDSESRDERVDYFVDCGSLGS